MFLKSFITAALLSQVTLAEIEACQSCPTIHVFGARETTVSPGYGSAGTVFNSILSAYPGSTAEAITYPACGGQSSCGGISYVTSALTGTRAVANAVDSFNQRCPSTSIVLVGYSQGGHIIDNAYCGGGDTNTGLGDTSIPINSAARNAVKAVIKMGNPRYTNGAPYNVGTCQQQGFAPRPSGFMCPSSNLLQSYCDSTDPYCCKGDDANSHQQYGYKYGQQALNFVKSRLG